MLACARCGQENPDEARFCLACGTAIAAATGPGEERRIVSVLFVDLVGFTTEAEQLDPEDVRAILSPYYDGVRGEIERFGGTVEKFIGDAVMGLFGAPVAHGDDPERAVRAALAVRDWADREDGLDVRVAVNTGARLQSSAPTGCVIVGEETYASTRTIIDYRPAAPVTAKGKSTPLRV